LLKKYLFLLFFASVLCAGAKEFTVVSYNVENLFDLKLDGTEYEEYTPNTKSWNKNTFNNKLKNIAKVLEDVDADIVGLQEIESKEALQALLLKLPEYKYFHFTKKQSSSVGVALISKFPIVSTSAIDPDRFDKRSRDILQATVIIDGKKLTLFVNHWRSKRAPESARIVYAIALKKAIDKLSEDEDYIILGDLNSNYNEYLSFKFDKKLNDTTGITGINQILNTTIKHNFVTKGSLFEYNQKVHYNLWLELGSSQRYSNFYRWEKNTPDHIILSKGLFDQKNIFYIDKSFYVFKPEYLLKKRKINRWNIYKGEGYSDHLPIAAEFSTTKQNYSFVKKEQNHFIETLYQIEQVSDFKLEDIVVIYKTDKIAIIKHRDQNICARAVMIYNPSKMFQLGGVYNITVEKLESYHGLKEIKKVSNIQKIKQITGYKEYYLDGKSIDLFDDRYQNNVITNLKGIYKKGYLYFRKDNKVQKIKLYFKKDIKRPKDGEKLSIISGHLGIYKSKVQIVLHNTTDYSSY
jgi:exonuclease III